MKFNITLFLSLFLLCNCSKDTTSEGPVSNESTQNAAALPLLKSSKSIGIIRGFNPSNPVQTTDSIESRWREAINTGMTSGRVQIDWPALEFDQGRFDQNVLREQLNELKRDGLQPFLLISAYDSEGAVLPSDLEGLPLNNPNVIRRFKALMDWVIPMLVEYEGYLISISNEADANFADNPTLNEELLAFLVEIRSHIHRINQNMAVTVTFAEGSLDSDREVAKEIILECDVASFNFYGGNATTTPPYVRTLSENEIRDDIQRMLEISGDKNIIIQELGMHTDQDLLGSSEEVQRRFFEVFFSEMQNEERIKAAYVFQLVDWSSEATALFRPFFPDDEVSIAFFETYATSLETLGLINYADGSQKLAWKEFLKWVTQLNAN